MEQSTTSELFDSVEEILRTRVRGFIQEIVEDEVTVAIERCRYARGGNGHRNGHRTRTLLTTHGKVEISLPRARIQTEEGEHEFRSAVIPKNKRLTKNVAALIVACYLCGVSTRKVQRALARALGPNVSKSQVSRVLAQLKPEWEAWAGRDLSKEQIERLILDGIVVHVKVGKKSHKMAILVALGVRSDGLKVALAFKEMGAESKDAWREILEDLSSRGVKQPDIVIADGSKGLEAALGEVWPHAPVQRCTVHKERNILAKAPESLQDELKEDYSRMMYAQTPDEVNELRHKFLAKWKPKCPSAAKSFEEAGDKLFTFTKFPPSQWKSLRTTNSIERLNEEFRRRVKVQGAQPSGESVCMLFWALLASGAVTMRRVDGFNPLSKTVEEKQEEAA
jgi:putative transposase